MTGFASALLTEMLFAIELLFLAAAPLGIMLFFRTVKAFLSGTKEYEPENGHGNEYESKM